MTVLIAEDERDLNNIIKKKLESDGYNVDNCYDGEEAINYLAVCEYDAVLLDIMMPKADGYEVVKYMREKSISTPVIFLTAKDSVDDIVKGLDCGANDYLVKPFSFAELGARLRAVTRKHFNMTGNILTVNDLTLDISTKSVKRAGKEIILSAKEYSLLEYLMMNKNIVLSKEKIENHVWNAEYEGGTNVVAVYINYLREKIDGKSEKKLISTVRGSGYVIRGE